MLTNSILLSNIFRHRKYTVSTEFCRGPLYCPDFFNEPITGENGRKLLRKRSKCSQLVKMSSNCPKMSQKYRLQSSDASLSEWTCCKTVCPPMYGSIYRIALHGAIAKHRWSNIAIRKLGPSTSLYIGSPLVGSDRKSRDCGGERRILALLVLFLRFRLFRALRDSPASRWVKWPGRRTKNCRGS